MNLSESYKSRLSELAGIQQSDIMPDKEISYPGTYTILTQAQADKKGATNLPVSFKEDGHHFEYQNAEELKFLVKSYPLNGEYEGSKIIGRDLNGHNFGMQ